MAILDSVFLQDILWDNHGAFCCKHIGLWFDTSLKPIGYLHASFQIRVVWKSELKGKLWKRQIILTFIWTIEALLFLINTWKIRVSTTEFKPMTLCDAGVELWSHTDLLSTLRLHDSVGKALHWHHIGHGFESWWSHLNFLVVCKRELLKLSR